VFLNNFVIIKRKIQILVVMKKILYGLSGLIILTFVIVLVTSAQNNSCDTKKDASEISADCPKCPVAAACEKKSEAKSCDGPKCKKACCESVKCKAGKDAPLACKSACSDAGEDIRKSDQPKRGCCSGK